MVLMLILGQLWVILAWLPSSSYNRISPEVPGVQKYKPGAKPRSNHIQSRVGFQEAHVHSPKHFLHGSGKVIFKPSHEETKKRFPNALLTTNLITVHCLIVIIFQLLHPFIYFTVWAPYLQQDFKSHPCAGSMFLWCTPHDSQSVDLPLWMENSKEMAREVLLRQGPSSISEVCYATFHHTA